MPKLPNLLFCSVSTTCISFGKRGNKGISIYLLQNWFFFKRKTLIRFSKDSPICLSPIFLLYGRSLIIFSYLKYCVWICFLRIGEFLVLIQTEKARGQTISSIQSPPEMFWHVFNLLSSAKPKMTFNDIASLSFHLYQLVDFLLIGIELVLPPPSQEFSFLQLKTNTSLGLWNPSEE